MVALTRSYARPHSGVWAPPVGMRLRVSPRDLTQTSRRASGWCRPDRFCLREITFNGAAHRCYFELSADPIRWPE